MTDAGSEQGTARDSVVFISLGEAEKSNGCLWLLK